MGKYRIYRFGKSFEFDPAEIEGYKLLLDFSNEHIKHCKADKNGNLWLETAQRNKIEIEDGPYENWQFKIYEFMPKYNTHAHLIGGIGRTIMFGKE